MRTDMPMGAVARMCPDVQPLKAQLEQVIPTTLPDGDNAWQIDFTLAIGPGVWTVVIDDVDSLERLYDEIALSGNERFGSVQPSSDRAPELALDTLLNEHEGAEFNLLSLIH